MNADYAALEEAQKEMVQLIRELHDKLHAQEAELQWLVEQTQTLSEEVTRLRKESTLRKAKRVREHADSFARPSAMSRFMKLAMLMEALEQ